MRKKPLRINDEILNDTAPAAKVLSVAFTLRLVEGDGGEVAFMLTEVDHNAGYKRERIVGQGRADSLEGLRPAVVAALADFVEKALVQR